MKSFEVGILTLCFLYGVTTTLASCAGGSISSSHACYQPCGRHDECKCNTTNARTYDTCDQTCQTLNCFSDINIICIAEQNCTQVCEPGSCNMTCNAEKYCDQKADNGVKMMSCFSGNGCSQSCAEGNCEMMHCEADNCLQTCGKGGCMMNCTESVKMCSQSCTANDKCVLECHAEVCLQECSGPAQCIIVNGASSRVYYNFPFIIAFLMLILQ